MIHLETRNILWVTARNRFSRIGRFGGLGRRCCRPVWAGFAQPLSRHSRVRFGCSFDSKGMSTSPAASSSARRVLLDPRHREDNAACLEIAAQLVKCIDRGEVHSDVGFGIEHEPFDRLHALRISSTTAPAPASADPLMSMRAGTTMTTSRRMGAAVSRAGAGRGPSACRDDAVGGWVSRRSPRWSIRAGYNHPDRKKPGRGPSVELSIACRGRGVRDKHRPVRPVGQRQDKPRSCPCLRMASKRHSAKLFCVTAHLIADVVLARVRVQHGWRKCRGSSRGSCGARTSRCCAPTKQYSQPERVRYPIVRPVAWLSDVLARGTAYLE